MSERFFSSETITADRARLDGAEAHHLLHVMRARVGQQITLFDGSGSEFTAVVEAANRSEASLAILEKRTVDRELPFPLVVGVALPKGDRQKMLVEKLTELGATRLVPLVTRRGVAQPTARAIDRLHRAGIEAAKQCGRNKLMAIAEPSTWTDWLKRRDSGGANQEQQPLLRLVAHPGGKPTAALDLASPRAAQIAIGPEGGLTDEEVTAAVEAGWLIVDLGLRILRVETAAIALSAAIGLSVTAPSARSH